MIHLSEQVALTTSHNLDLTSKLKLAEGEIESYKKLLQNYHNEISEMKVKHLNNELKSEYLHNHLSKENEKSNKQTSITNNNTNDGANLNNKSTTISSNFFYLIITVLINN